MQQLCSHKTYYTVHVTILERKTVHLWSTVYYIFIKYLLYSQIQLHVLASA